MIAALLIAAGMAGTVPPCTARQLSIATDGEDGGFNGMSHSGTLLVLRNRGPNACVMLRRPRLIFAHDKRTLPISAGRIPGLTAITIPAGATVATPLRWVSGNVYGNGRCLTVTTIMLSISGRTLRSPLAATLCGEATGPIRYEQLPLRPDPAAPGR